MSDQPDPGGAARPDKAAIEGAAPGKRLGAAARRALAEAAARRREADAAASPPSEVNGPAGPEPTRYGDWERKGRATDF